uniref:NAC-A/B domain-containing protein n=1 Tax=Timspurckia oligopyrenoides TaxID=708627 RepID=A0A7S0ZC26_9RHOD|mmetsp:Transcript_12003/g.21733  ORF Transcript_12003/g.21733 Transcript_12003/m.21733 type:complete len:201 (+) Transcript_12003:61-663(+)
MTVEVTENLEAVEKPEETKVEDAEEEDDEAVPELESTKDADAAAVEGDEREQSRAEKKSRKALSKLGLKPVEGITRFSVMKNKQTLFVVNKPDVFKSPTSNQYVIFGEAKVEDLSSQAQNAAAEQFKVNETAETETKEAQEPVEEEEEEGEVDAGGLTEADIELVMEQGSASRAKAIRALQKSSGDVVDAIMQLSLGPSA